VLFADVVRSTAFGEDVDPELVRQVLSRWYAEMRSVIHRHGGTVEKFAGDEVMAVFGVPVVHEDDALRAVRAATEMRDRLRTLNDELWNPRGLELRARIGVNTGEVVAGDPATGETFVTGDAVNVARRLEQAAAPDEILIGKATFPLVKDAVTVGQLQTFPVKGKRHAVARLRLDEVGAAERGVARRLDAPIVGRELELRAVFDAFERSASRSTGTLFTLLGAAGIGKSRLVSEFVDAVGDEANVLRGHCLPYGEGITYWPLAEAVAQAAGLRAGGSLEEARNSIAALFASDDDASGLADEIAQLLGLSDATISPHEASRAVSTLFGRLAVDRPLVVVFEDLERAETSFLDLIEQVADASRRHPILILCVARPELLEVRPDWRGRTGEGSALVLEPLDDEATRTLIRRLFADAPVDESATARIVKAAGGNALYAEQYVAMLVAEGRLTRVGGAWAASGDLSSLAIPPSIQAVLGARIDQLPAQERRVLERAAVEGRVFHLAAVKALSVDEADADLELITAELVRKGLIRSAEPLFAGEEAYEFGHPLIREAAYAAIPKEVRADLHWRFASWLESTAGAGAWQHDELIGYHLEQAYLLRSGLGLADDRARDIGTRASTRLGAAGRRALAREDQRAARNLLQRAIAVAPDPASQAELLPHLGEALMRTGDLEGARRAYDDGVEAALVQDDRRLEALARLGRAKIRTLIDPVAAWQDAAGEREYAIGLLEESGDDWALALTLRDVAEDHLQHGRVDEGIGTLERALRHAELAGDERRQARIRRRLLSVVVTGPTPVAEALRYAEELDAWAKAHGNLGAEAWGMLGRGTLAALEERFDSARALIGEGMGLLEEIDPLQFATAAYLPFLVEMLAENPAAAERAVRIGYDLLERMGERAYFSTHAALLAHAVYAQGRIEEADRFSSVGETLAAADDLSSQVLWRSARAKVLARRGAAKEAESVAIEAVELAQRTISHFTRTNALLDLCEVRLLGRRPAQAAIAAEKALALCKEKGDIASSSRTWLMLGEIGATTP
jgi:class 3 adenylate cyclase/tetratricopeptide (TPR) repeat protein